MRIAIVGQDCEPRSNTLWFEVLRILPNSRLFLPVQASRESELEARLQSVAPDLCSRIELVPVRMLLGETSMLWSGLHRRIQMMQPELIHVVAEPWAPVAQQVSRWPSRFVIHSAENVLASAPLPYKFRRIGMRAVLKRASGAVSWGHTGLAAMREVGLPDTTPVVLCASRVPNPRSFHPSPLDLDATPLRVAYCGRLVMVKGVQTLIEALQALPPTSARLRVLGDGPYRGSLEALSRKRATPVDFLGQGSESQVADLLRWSHVVVVPTLVSRRYKEQWGRITVEALMSGRAVIASDSGELPFNLNDPEMVFPHGDHRSLAVLLQRLAEDREFLQLKAASALERSHLFTPEVQAGGLVGLWSDVLESVR